MDLLFKKSFTIKLVIFISTVGFLMFQSSCKEKIVVNEQSLTAGWQIISSAKIDEDGKTLSSGQVSDKNWVDAKVPTTVLGALIDAGIYKDVFFADNLKKIPTEPFENPWWFKKQFSVDNFNSNNEELRLFIDGINYRANIWLNGELIASQDSIFGAFRQFEIDITNQAKPSNILVFEIIPPKPRDFYMGFVDWAPTPPDKYMGIYREVRLKRTGRVSLTCP